MSLILRFTEWECGHHMTRPEDIQVVDAEQATLIVRAISHAISQPGHARALLLSQEAAQEAYITDDYVSIGHGSARSFGAGTHFSPRPQVICCTPEQQNEIHSAALNDAIEALFVCIEPWDGKALVCGNQIISTTLSKAEVEALAAPPDAYEQRRAPFDLPPVYLDANEVLTDLRQEATYIVEQEGGAA